jgi:hypothetical protein
MLTERTRVLTARGRQLETRPFDADPTEVDPLAALRAAIERAHLVDRGELLAELPERFEPCAPRCFLP